MINLDHKNGRGASAWCLEGSLHVEGELELRVSVGVVNFEEAVYELLQIDIAARFEVEHSEESLADDTGQLTVL